MTLHKSRHRCNLAKVYLRKEKKQSWWPQRKNLITLKNLHEEYSLWSPGSVGFSPYAWSIRGVIQPAEFNLTTHRHMRTEVNCHHVGNRHKRGGHVPLLFASVTCPAPRTFSAYTIIWRFYVETPNFSSKAFLLLTVSTWLKKPLKMKLGFSVGWLATSSYFRGLNAFVYARLSMRSDVAAHFHHFAAFWPHKVYATQ